MSAAWDAFDPTTPAMPHISDSPLTAINTRVRHEKNRHPRYAVITYLECAEFEREHRLKDVIDIRSIEIHIRLVASA